MERCRILITHSTILQEKSNTSKKNAEIGMAQDQKELGGIIADKMHPTVYFKHQSYPEKACGDIASCLLSLLTFVGVLYLFSAVFVFRVLSQQRFCGM